MVLSDLKLEDQDQDKAIKNMVLDSELDTKTITIIFIFLDLIACGLPNSALLF